MILIASPVRYANASVHSVTPTPVGLNPETLFTETALNDVADPTLTPVIL